MVNEMKRVYTQDLESIGNGRLFVVVKFYPKYMCSENCVETFKFHYYATEPMKNQNFNILWAMRNHTDPFESYTYVQPYRLVLLSPTIFVDLQNEDTHFKLIHNFVCYSQINAASLFSSNLQPFHFFVPHLQIFKDFNL